MSIIAIIVTFNRLKQLQDNLLIVLDLDFFKVVVVNNASTDGTGEYLDKLSRSKYKSKLHVVHSSSNIGGAGGFYLGISESHQRFAFDWFLLFDDDAYPDITLLSKFRSNKFSNDVGAVACSVYHPSGDIAEMNRPSINPFASMSIFLKTLKKGRSGFHIKDIDYSGSNREIDVASFVGLFVRHKLIDVGLGFPMKELFLYGDDVLYCWKIRKMGYQIIFSPEMIFYHNCATFLESSNAYKPLWKAFYRYRNSLLVYRKFAGVLYPLVFIWKSWEWFWNYRFYTSKTTYFRMYIHSIYKGLLGILNDTPKDILKKYSSE